MSDFDEGKSIRAARDRLSRLLEGPVDLQGVHPATTTLGLVEQQLEALWPSGFMLRYARELNARYDGPYPADVRARYTYCGLASNMRQTALSLIENLREHLEGLDDALQAAANAVDDDEEERGEDV